MLDVRQPRSHLTVAAGRLAVVLALALAAAAWGLFIHRVSTARPVPHVDIPQPNAVVWHRRVYQSRAELARNLKKQGKSYYVWARQHPAAAELLATLAVTSRRR